MSEIDISENVQTSQVPICPKCKTYPIFSMHQTDFEKIKEYCPVCNSTNEKTITSVLNEIYIDPNNFKYKCELLEHENDENDDNPVNLYCIQCEKWLCKSCKSSHSKEHDIIEGENRIPSSCQEHKLQYKKFCNNCNKNLCQTCINQHNTEHQLLNTEELLLKEQSHFETFFKSLKNHNRELKKFHKNIIDSINKYKNDIDNAFKKSQQLNYNIQKMYESFFNKLSYTKNNYHLYKNLKNFANFSLKKFKYELTNSFNFSSWTIKDLNEYKQYLDNGAIIVQSENKTFAGIQRLATIKNEDFVSTITNYIDNTNQNELIIIGYSSGAIGITEITSATEIHCNLPENKKHKGVIFSLCVDGNYLYSGGDDQIINKWEIVHSDKKEKEKEKQKEKYKLVYKQQYRGHKREVSKIISIPEEKLMVSCSLDKTIIIWETSSHEENVKPLKIIKMNDNIISILYIPEIKSLISFLQNNKIDIRHIKEEKKESIINNIPCCSTNCVNRVGDNIIVGGNYLISKLKIKDSQIEMDCQREITKEKYPEMKITKDILNVIPFQQDKVLFGNIQNRLFIYNFKDEQIEFREITGKKNIDGMYILNNNKFALSFGKIIDIMSN